VNAPKPVPVAPGAPAIASIFPSAAAQSPLLNRSQFVDAAVQNPIRKIGLYLLLLYIFLFFSRMIEFTLPFGRVPVIIFAAMAIAAVGSGGLLRVLHCRVAWAMIALIVWEAITVPFSTWSGGSTLMLWESIRALGVALVLIGVCTAANDPRKVMVMLGFSVLFGALIGIFFGKFEFGRLVMEIGSFKDPNFYATTLVIGFPAWLMYLYASPNKVVKFLAFACMIPILFVFLQTGSRGGMIGLIVVFIGLFFQVRLPQKLGVMGIVCIVLLLAVFALPDYLRSRFATFYEAPSADATDLVGGDIGSTYARMQLLRDSGNMTLKHPVFGVGMGMFGQINWEQARERGEPGLANVTHNTYTQLSSETGIPGLLIFLALLYQSFKALNKVLQLGKSPAYKIPENVLIATRYVRLCLLGLCACAASLSLAYSPLFFVITALAASVELSVQRNLPGWTVSAVREVVRRPDWPAAQPFAAVLPASVTGRPVS